MYYWLRSEYLLKGVFLGLLLFAALQEPDWSSVGRLASCTIGGLAIALVIAAVRKSREGVRPHGRFSAYVLFLLLESPKLVFAGVLFGMFAGVLWIRTQERGSENTLIYSIVSGLGLGVILGLLPDVRNKWARFGLNLALGSALVTLALALFGHLGNMAGLIDLSEEGQWRFGITLILGIPLFYLLSFVGQDEETEVEIGVMCALLALGVWLLKLTPTFRAFSFLLPIAVYYVYTIRILPGLRVFKHSLRGFSYARIGRYRHALLSLRRALQLEPTNSLAREALWSVHRSLDLPELMKDPETLALVDVDLCLERAAALLLQGKPAPEKILEAERLLDLVLNQRPEARPTVLYWRAVAHTHAKFFDRAAEELAEVLDPNAYPAGDGDRRSILLAAWQLALTLHDELRRRVGQPQLALPGRRMEGIAAVERHLAANIDDAAAWNLKRLLYQDLTEADYQAAASNEPPAEFEHAYAQQLGLALIEDRTRWRRGCEYLRIAACGLPLAAPMIFVQIAQACQKADEHKAAWQNYEHAKRAARAVGTKNLPDADRHEFFAVIKVLAEAQQAHSDFAGAIDNYVLYSEYERSGLETLRTLADLYEKKGDALSALRVTENALVFSGKDKDLLDRKDKYYYSVTPEELQARLESAKNGFDVEYCLRKSRTLLDLRDADFDLLEWAQHLADLAAVIQPNGIAARVLQARARLRRGEKEAAVGILEGIYNNKPEKFATGDDSEGWYTTCRLLGDIYLDELSRPDLAVPCFLEFRKSSKSGANTLYKLGQAHEQLGDKAKAVKFYEQVTSYSGHPLEPDARDAIYRLKAS